MCEAVNSRTNWKLQNTEVNVFNGEEVTVYLHGNAIFRIVDGIKYWSFAGWPTRTTKSRLRALGIDYKQPIPSIYAWNQI